MSKKEILFELAEKLYISEQMSINKIALKLNLDRKTIMNWRDEGNWQEKRFQLLQAERLFHQDLYVFSRKLMHVIQEQIENGEEPTPSKMLMFTRILSLLNKTREYEELISKKESKNQNKGLTEEVINQIQEDILGIKSKNKDYR